MLFVLTIFMLFSVFDVDANTEETIKGITTAFSNGDAKALAKYFNPTIELEILNEENIYSKAQTELILRDFFARNKPISFRVNHQGSKGLTSFAIGILVSAKGSFRVSIFMKSDQNNLLIHQIRIESGEG